MFPGFSKKKKAALTAYDPSIKRPALRCSICTGEQVAGFKNLSDGKLVAGFKNLSDGKFEEVMLIRNESDLQAFREQYGITGNIEKIY